ncbi:MAG: hypothetical protein OXO50_15435 [Caldilineaceae bacterium]|nr:hypothetical protein [Caldilineaceae bacterium]
MKKAKFRKEIVTMTLSPSSKKPNRTDSQVRQNGTGPDALSRDVQKDPDGKSETSRDHDNEFMRHVRESVKKNHQLYKLLAE